MARPSNVAKATVAGGNKDVGMGVVGVGVLLLLLLLLLTRDGPDGCVVSFKGVFDVYVLDGCVSDV